LLIFIRSGDINFRNIWHIIFDSCTRFSVNFHTWKIGLQQKYNHSPKMSIHKNRYYSTRKSGYFDGFYLNFFLIKVQNELFITWAMFHIQMKTWTWRIVSSTSILTGSFQSSNLMGNNTGCNNNNNTCLVPNLLAQYRHWSFAGSLDGLASNQADQDLSTVWLNHFLRVSRRTFYEHQLVWKIGTRQRLVYKIV